MSKEKAKGQCFEKFFTQEWLQREKCEKVSQSTESTQNETIRDIGKINVGPSFWCKTHLFLTKLEKIVEGAKFILRKSPEQNSDWNIEGKIGEIKEHECIMMWKIHLNQLQKLLKM